MFGTGIQRGEAPRTDFLVLEATGHGITLNGTNNNVPVPVYINSGTSTIELADATDPAKQKAGFVTKILDANNVVLQTVGFHYAPSHGLAAGNYYWVDAANPGEVVNTAPVAPNGNDICFYVWSPDWIELIDNRRI